MPFSGLINMISPPTHTAIHLSQLVLTGWNIKG
jgi:hypothetical protein